MNFFFNGHLPCKIIFANLLQIKYPLFVTKYSYIYIYIERERERERENKGQR